MAKLGVRNRCADPNRDDAADLVAHLVEQQRQAQGQTDVARELKQPAVLASKKTGTTVAPARAMALAVNSFHSGSTARRWKIRAEVATAPPGNTTRAPPSQSHDSASARDCKLVASAAGVPAKSIGSRYCSSSRARQRT